MSINLTLAEANDWQLTLCFTEWLRNEAEAGTSIPRQDLVRILRANHIAGVRYWAQNEVNDESASPITEEDMPQTEDDGGPFEDDEEEDEPDTDFDDLKLADLSDSWSDADKQAFALETVWFTIHTELARINSGFRKQREGATRQSHELGPGVDSRGMAWVYIHHMSSDEQLRCREVILKTLLDVFPIDAELFEMRVSIRDVMASFEDGCLCLAWSPKAVGHGLAENIVWNLEHRTDLVWQIN